MNSCKQGHALDNLKEESRAEDTEEKSEAEKKDHREPEMHGIKREFEEMETSSGLTDENKHTEPTMPAKKKGKGIKNTDDKQSSLLNYFGRR